MDALVKALILLMSYSFVQTFLFIPRPAGGNCTVDTNCTQGCCFKGRCSGLALKNHPCHIPNEPYPMAENTLYPCGCETGLICEEIKHGHKLDHAAVAALFSGGGTGVCR